jgi:hypothetical protein
VSWFRVNRGRLEYRGRITRDPFTAWTATKDGREAVARQARGIRFHLLGRSRGARRGMWRTLEAASRSEPVAAAIALEATYYMRLLASLCYASALPRTHIALHRLVLAPRAMAAGRAHAGVFARMADLPALAELDEALRAFFLHQLVIEMDAALRTAAPSPRRPVQAQDEWACVGVSIGMVWVDRILAGPDGTGHVFMYEFPRDSLSRRNRKALEQAIEQMAASASALSRAERFALIRSASLQ